MNLTNALGWTLVHFLWQGALIAALLAGVLPMLRHAGSQVRYAACCGAILLMLVCAAGTLLELRFQGMSPALDVARLVSPGLSSPARGIDLVASASGAIDYLPALVWTWLAGVVAFSIRSIGGWAVAERFARRHNSRAEALWEERFASLAKRLRISKPVRLAVSGLAQVPAVVGWVRPVVLVPASIFTGLGAEQIEALLAHELAHVRRHDYLVNLLQTAAETLFFYHPAVWWVNRRIRDERENCCDDLAVEVCGSALAYVRALADMEQMRHSTPRFAMAADGGSLLSRIQRLLHVEQAGTVSSRWAAGIAIVAVLSIAGIAAKGLAQRPEQSNAEARQRNADIDQRNEAIQRQNGDIAKPSADVQTSWLAEIQAAGMRDLNVDKLIEMKIQGVTADYIRQMRADGLELTADQLVEFRVQNVTDDFIKALRQSGLKELTPDKIVELKVQGIDAAWVRQIQSVGYPDVSVDKAVELRVQGITPEFIREARSHFKDITLDQLIQLKILGIMKTR